MTMATTFSLYTDSEWKHYKDPIPWPEDYIKVLVDRLRFVNIFCLEVKLKERQWIVEIV
jgi:hypothetical protein